MSEKPEQQTESTKPAQSRTLSFDEVMAQASQPPAPKAVPPRKVEKAEPKKPAQPSFDEILAGARPAAEGSSPPAPQGERRPRPEKRRDERKAPVVVRKPALGAQPEGAPAAAGAEAAAPPASPAESSAQATPRPPREPRPAQPMAESAFAKPMADEATDFAALFEAATRQRHEKLKPGSKVTARIAHIGGEVAFLDLGGKGEGILDLRELRGESGEQVAQAGDVIEAYVLSVAEGNITLTRSVPKGAGREILAQALEAKTPVDGTVTGQNKGGLEVDLGGMRGFCPASQIDVRFVEDTSVFVGQKLKFLVTELRGGNAILTRRALLDEERAGKAKELREKLEVGATLEGVITSVRDFGAFVDLGGLEGLVHVSELSHQRVAHAQDVVKPNQKVRVQVLRIEKDKEGHERIALSLRALEQDPWDAARGQIAEGQKLQGRVARLQPFGAFVELFPGVDGLVHVSALSDRHVTHPREVVKEGETIWVQVDSIDDAQRRVALRRITEDEARSPDPVPPRAARPSGGAATPGGKRNQAGPRAATERSSPRADDFDYHKEMKKMAAKGLGTLGDLLRAKLQAKEDDE